MREILEIAAKVGGLSGVSVAFLFLIFRQIVARNLFPKLTQKYGADVLLAIIDRIYKIVLAVLFLSFVAFVISKAVPGPNPPPGEASVTVSLPDNISLKNAILLLVDNDRSTANFKSGCPEALLNLKVRGGTISARDTAELISQLNYRLIGPKVGLTIYVTKDKQRGIYEINCIR